MTREEHRFLYFTRRERTGILLLLGIMLLLILIPRIYPSFIEKPHYNDSAFREAVAVLERIKADSSNRYDNERKSNTYSNRPFYKSDAPGGELFVFDPNTLSAEGWQRLGLREKTAATILKYTSKGGRFRKPEDLYKIWGLTRQMADRLLPYVRIAETATASARQEAYTKTSSYPARTPAAPRQVDINMADTTVFIALPGIGSKLAGRIVAFREKLGGFYSVDQVKETYGLADSVFQRIRPMLRLENVVVKKININTATLEQLKQHPYIRYQAGNAILQYRQQHGMFGQPADLLKIALITEELYNKLSPYITTAP